MDDNVIAQLYGLAIARRFEILQSIRFARIARQPTDNADYRKLVLEREVNDAAIAQLEQLQRKAA